MQSKYSAQKKTNGNKQQVAGSRLQQHHMYENPEQQISQFGDSLLVPAEEIEEEAPLRIRTLQYDDDEDLYAAEHANVISIDLNKYLQAQ